MNRRLLHLIVSKSLGCLLLVAAGLKIYGLGVQPVGSIGIFSAPTFEVGLIEFEILLGVWLLSGLSPIGGWLLALVAFAGFASVSLYLGWIGQASCRCFGQLSVSPWYALAIDVAALLALVIARPVLKPLRRHPRATLVRALGRSVAGLIGLSLMLAVLGGLTMQWFGSTDAGLAYLRGERISVRPSFVDVGAGVPGEKRESTIELLNRTDRVIRIIGGLRTVPAKLPIICPWRSHRRNLVSL